MTGIPDPWGSPLYDLLVAACGRAENHHAAYERTGRTAELDLAINGFAAVLEVARNVDVRGAALNGLGVALWSRYERSGAPADLDAAVDLFRDALALYPDERTPATPSFHANLSGVLRLRWRSTRSEADLLASVDEIRCSVAATSPSDRRMCWRLNHLADGLLSVALHHDDSSALREAVGLFRQALDQAGPGDDVAGLRSNLGEALRLDYLSGGGRDRSLLDDAVAQARQALAASRDPALRPRFQSNLALVLLDRYHARHRSDDLAEAAALARAAVEATPKGHPNRAERLLVLSGIERTTTPGAAPRRRAVRRMVKAAHAAAAAVPDGHQLRADALVNEGAALAFQAAQGDVAAYGDAISVFRTVALDETAAVRARVSAARQWANCALARTGVRDVGPALEPFALAVELLPRTAPRRVTHADRARRLASFSGLARDAAACAVAAGDPAGALRLLEHGRGVLLGQALDARTELVGLREVRPDLAERFEVLRFALDRPEGTGFSSGPAVGTLPGEERHASALAWDVLLDEIRAVPGFAGFLRPPEVDDLVTAARRHGPIVVVNVSGLRSDALLIADGTVVTLPLRLDLADLVDRAREFRSATTMAEHPGLPADARAEARRTVAEMLEWLWAVVAEPVLATLTPPEGSRLWWVPTGPLGTLPLHAAAPEAGPGVLDRVVSSYVPTVRGLVTAWDTAPAARPAGPLVVAVPSEPGVPGLPGVPAETAKLTARFPGSTVLTGEHATRQAVLDALPRHAWAHFACHAVSAADGAADGHLVLHDHAAAPLTVADIARLRLAHADLAYLSACDTGVPEEDLGDEALHVAGACHMAGFRHVIATLWSVRDTLAPAVADDFYAALGSSDTAAHALQHTVRDLRAVHPDSPAGWAPYVHVGP